MLVLYVVTTNSAIRARNSWNVKGYLWDGNNTFGGFYAKREDDGNFSLVYVEENTGKVYISVNYRVPWDSDGYVIEMLLGYKGWQLDPETGTRIMYRVLEPVEYLFQDYEEWVFE